MHHDRHDKTDMNAFSTSGVAELEVMARAERLRGQYLGEWLRHWFRGGSRAAISDSVEQFEPAAGLHPRRS